MNNPMRPLKSDAINPMFCSLDQMKQPASIKEEHEEYRWLSYCDPSGCHCFGYNSVRVAKPMQKCWNKFVAIKPMVANSRTATNEV
jgi:hypothetical protein